MLRGLLTELSRFRPSPSIAQNAKDFRRRILYTIAELFATARKCNRPCNPLSPALPFARKGFASSIYYWRKRRKSYIATPRGGYCAPTRGDIVPPQGGHNQVEGRGGTIRLRGRGGTIRLRGRKGGTIRLRGRGGRHQAGGGCGR